MILVNLGPTIVAKGVTYLYKFRLDHFEQLVRIRQNIRKYLNFI